jgi:Family of unknown function (DUF6455)
VGHLDHVEERRKDFLDERSLSAPLRTRERRALFLCIDERPLPCGAFDPGHGNLPAEPPNISRRDVEELMITYTVGREDPLLIFEMMNRLGIEPAGGVLPQYALRYMAARRSCEACAAKPSCRLWLDAHEVAPFAPHFCPSGDTLFELQFDQHSSHLG